MEASNEVIEIIDTKITDKWGVQWNEMETVRDFLQNFYDDNDVEDIKIEVVEKTVKISAPKTFDYQELIYLGSDKSLNTDKIGQYGEGWKASVLNVLRNFDCTVQIQIEDKKLVFYFEDKKVGKTVKRIIFCKVLRVPPIKGSMLVVGNCSDTIINEFKFGLRYFYYDRNPLIGEELASTYDKQVLFFKSTDNFGYIFYKRLLRSRLDAPIVIVCNKSYHHVETKIRHDRDRKAFNDEVLESLLRYVCKHVRGVKNIVEYMRPFWGTGHKLLNVLAITNRNANINFPENYYAKDVSSDAHDKDFDLTLESERILNEFEKSGYIVCPHYMSFFGMKTPRSQAKKKLDQKLTNHLQRSSRDLVLQEQNALNLLLDFIKRFSTGLYSKCQGYKYIIGDTQDIVNDLKKSKAYDDKKIFLSKAFYTYNFEDSLIFLVTEFSEQYGIKHENLIPDFYASFLTALLKEEAILTILKKYKFEWNELTGMIIEQTDFIPISPMVEKNKKKNELINLFTNGKIDDLIDALKDCTFKDQNTEDAFLLLCEQYTTWQNDNLIGISNDKSLGAQIKRGLLQIVREAV